RRSLRPAPALPPDAPPARESRRPRGNHAPDHEPDRRAAPRRRSLVGQARRGRRFVTDAGTPPGSGKPWGGRFTPGTAPAAEAFTSSLAFDRRLWRHDIRGSAAWAKALERAWLIDAAERAAIGKGLEDVRAELESGRFKFRPELEDVHMNIERRLIEIAGDVGGKLHTGRSRNDQIALDERLYLRDVLGDVDEALQAVQGALLDQAERHREAAMPGYTHLQRAQPVLLAHHLLASLCMLDRAREAFADSGRRGNAPPLVPASRPGAAFSIDRDELAKDLGFAGSSANSMDAVADRDYVIEFLAAAAVLGMHCSRLAADLALWATAEFGFVEFSDAFATGSSIMPQKKNPDVAELIRGKTGRLYGNLVAVLATRKGLPLTYNSDMQEDKDPFFDAVDPLEAVLRVLPPMLESLTFRVDRMREAAGTFYSTATDLADYLVRKGLPFREAHEIVGRTVRHGIAQGKELADFSLEELRRFSPRIEKDVHAALTVEASLRARSVIGGTAPEAVARALAEARKRIPKERRRGRAPGGAGAWASPSRRAPRSSAAAARRAPSSPPSAAGRRRPPNCAPRSRSARSWSPGRPRAPGPTGRGCAISPSCACSGATKSRMPRPSPPCSRAIVWSATSRSLVSPLTARRPPGSRLGATLCPSPIPRG